MPLEKSSHIREIAGFLSRQKPDEIVTLIDFSRDKTHFFVILTHPIRLTGGLGTRATSLAMTCREGYTNAAGAWMRKSSEIERFEDDVSSTVTVRRLELVGEPCHLALITAAFPNNRVGNYVL